MNGSGRRLKGLTNAITHNIQYILHTCIYILQYTILLFCSETKTYMQCVSQKNAVKVYIGAYNKIICYAILEIVYKA